MSKIRLAAILTFAACLFAASSHAERPGADVGARPDPSVACHVGLYQLDDKSWLDVAPLESEGLRWLRLDGSTGRMTREADGRWVSTLGFTGRIEGPQPQLAACADGQVSYEGQAGRRMELVSIDTTFVGYGGARLRGRLILPQGNGRAPIMVEVHGSEGANALDFNSFQRFAPASGVGVFVYAKRGSGGSEGHYTQDFHVLAADAAAAVVEARRLAGGRAGRVGLHGSSQGGWVAPLAATLTDVDFVVVGFGLAYGPLSEDSDQVAQDLAAAGWGPDIVEAVQPILAATHDFVASHGRVGFDRLIAVRARYGSEPWFPDIKGEFTGMLLNTPDDAINAMLPMLDDGPSWDYDPLQTLRRLSTPMLWILASEDRSAPPDATRRRLLELSAQGRPINVLEFPDADHGILRFETSIDGRRTALSFAPGYFQALLDWARDPHLGTGYGDARVLSRNTVSPSDGGRERLQREPHR